MSEHHPHRSADIERVVEPGVETDRALVREMETRAGREVDDRREAGDPCGAVVRAHGLPLVRGGCVEARRVYDVAVPAAEPCRELSGYEPEPEAAPDQEVEPLADADLMPVVGAEHDHAEAVGIDPDAVGVIGGRGLDVVPVALV